MTTKTERSEPSISRLRRKSEEQANWRGIKAQSSLSSTLSSLSDFEEAEKLGIGISRFLCSRRTPDSLMQQAILNISGHLERARERDWIERRGSKKEGEMERGEQDFVLQWGYRKRLRCVKPQVKDDEKAKESHLCRRQPSRHDRLLRSLVETTAGGGGGRMMKGNGVRTSPRERGGGGGGGRVEEGKAGNKGTASIEAHDKKGGPSSSSGSEAAAWPSIVIGLTNKEKEEDFMEMKGSKPPHRPKKRAKYLQKTINSKRRPDPLIKDPMVIVVGPYQRTAYHARGSYHDHHKLVTPGAWLCDLTLERYEVREKKISKKRPRGLKAMGDVDSDSE